MSGCNRRNWKRLSHYLYTCNIIKVYFTPFLSKDFWRIDKINDNFLRQVEWKKIKLKTMKKVYDPNILLFCHQHTGKYRYEHIDDKKNVKRTNELF